MTWFHWTLIVLWWVNVLTSIALIGEEREPRTPIDAMASVISAGLFTVGLLYYTS